MPLADFPPDRPAPLAEQQLRLLSEHVPAIVWTTDTALRFTSAIGAGLEPLGAVPGAVRIAMQPVLGDSEAARVSLAAHERALQGERASYAVSWQCRLYECSLEPLRMDGRIVGCIGVAIDVTERRRAERNSLAAYEEAIQLVVRAIEFRDLVTGEHVERMSEYCLLIAEGLGLEPAQRQSIALAARLHDIGKIAVPDGILLKAGPLTDDERKTMQRHCVVGHQILSTSRSDILELAATIALTHHERFDGGGYPQGIAGEAIPLEGRIAAIADSFDALTSDRPYRQALSAEEAKTVMIGERGTHFDPDLLDLLLLLLRTRPLQR